MKWMLNCMKWALIVAVVVSLVVVFVMAAVTKAHAEEGAGSAESAALDPSLILKQVREDLEGAGGAHALFNEGVKLLDAGPGQEGHARRLFAHVVEKTTHARMLVGPLLEDAHLSAPVRAVAYWYAGDAERLQLLSTLRATQKDGSVKGRPIADVGIDLSHLSELYQEALLAMETSESEKFFAADRDRAHGAKEYAEKLRKLLAGVRQAQQQTKQNQSTWSEGAEAGMNKKGERSMQDALGKNSVKRGSDPNPQMVPVPQQGDPQDGYSPGVPPGLH